MNTRLHQCLVCFASFLCNGLVFGMINTFGIVYDTLVGRDNGKVASLKTSIVGGLPNALLFLSSAVAGMLIQTIGIRKTSAIGITLCVLALVISSFTSNSIVMLYITIGIMLGIGSSFVYIPAMSILLYHFDENFGSINGIVTTGAAIFTIVFSVSIRPIIKTFGLGYVFMIQAALYSLLYIGVFVWTKPASYGSLDNEEKHLIKRKVSMKELWNIKAYRFWLASFLVLRIGYGTAYLYLVRFTVEQKVPYNGDHLIMAIGFGSIVGRLIFGKISDSRHISRIVLHQIAVYIYGVLLVLIPIGIKNKYAMYVISSSLGITTGIVNSLIVPICNDILGPSRASRGMSVAMSLMGIPIMLGPVVSGVIRDITGTYTTVFNINAIWAVIAAFMTLGAFYTFLQTKITQDTDSLSSSKYSN
ncbi:hypothetical protein A3Q56_03063 [Intoshia linei]|uniref:Major facilitator superfamily (MFS) profile domain-containing protein n=1 Tax=Intoshia linei TaxID=1819745 RepID=A0A177B4G4_9BILA|nr:hypothetical protein A3Q56_03063 [Intoshia linei]